MKSFLYTTYGSEGKALQYALEYRDSILENHFILNLAWADIFD